MIADVPALIHACAPFIDQELMRAIIRAESSGNPWSLADAGEEGRPWSERRNQVRSISSSDRAHAEAAATKLIHQGHIVAIGLAQVSSRNLARFGLTPAQTFDPCVNVRTGARILAEALTLAPSVEAALSIYNTGNTVDGVANGYVDRVLGRSITRQASNGANSYNAPLEAGE